MIQQHSVFQCSGYRLKHYLQFIKCINYGYRCYFHQRANAISWQIFVYPVSSCFVIIWAPARTSWTCFNCDDNNLPQMILSSSVVMTARWCCNLCNWETSSRIGSLAVGKSCRKQQLLWTCQREILNSQVVFIYYWIQNPVMSVPEQEIHVLLYEIPTESLY